MIRLDGHTELGRIKMLSYYDDAKYLKDLESAFVHQYDMVSCLDSLISTLTQDADDLRKECGFLRKNYAELEKKYLALKGIAEGGE